MQPLEDIYKGSFFSRRNRLAWRVPHVCDAVCKVYNVRSVIDVGCAIGDYVKGFQERGMYAVGLEGSSNCIPYLEIPEGVFFRRDLRKKIDVGWYDLVICLEVLEHIEPEYADMLVGNLSGMSDKLLLSAALPGQGGHYHVNCQERRWWEEKFEKHDYLLDIETMAKIRDCWKPVRHKKEMGAYYNNLICFNRKEIEGHG